jgi:Zn-finger protein
MGASQHEIPNSSSFFRNVSCPYFPCHEGVDEGEFNCLFCYCPLYALGPRCGGDFTYTATGIKDCSGCTRLHRGDQGIALVRAKFSQLSELARSPEDVTDMPRGGDRCP